MRILIDNYRNLTAEHCGSGSMRNLVYHFCQLELPEGVIMGPDYETFTFNPPVYPVFAVQIEVPVRGEFCKGATKLSQRNDFTRPQWHHYR